MLKLNLKVSSKKRGAATHPKSPSSLSHPLFANFLILNSLFSSSPGPLSAAAPAGIVSNGFNSSSIAQFGASIFLGGSWDWEPQGTGAPSRCFGMVDRVTEYNIESVQFIPTLYWWDQGPTQPWPPGFDRSCSNATLASYYVSIHKRVPNILQIYF